MKLSEFKYKLPQEKIATHPTRFRDESKMLVLHRKTGEIEHKMFKDIIKYFNPHDLFIFNDTKVFPAQQPQILMDITTPSHCLEGCRDCCFSLIQVRNVIDKGKLFARMDKSQTRRKAHGNNRRMTNAI